MVVKYRLQYVVLRILQILFWLSGYLYFILVYWWLWIFLGYNAVPDRLFSKMVDWLDDKLDEVDEKLED